MECAYICDVRIVGMLENTICGLVSMRGRFCLIFELHIC